MGGRLVVGGLAICVALLTTCSVAQANRNLYVSNNPGGINIFDISAEGALTPVTGSPLAAGPFPEGVALTPDGKHLFLSDFTDDTIRAYDVAASGALTPVAGPPVVLPGATPAGLAVSPDGGHLYATLFTDQKVAAFAIGANGALTQINGSPYPAAASAIAIAMTPDGKHLYVLNRIAPNLTAYNVAADGTLTPITGSPFLVPAGSPRGVGVTPNGRFLYVVVPGATNGVAGYSIAADGVLTSLAGSPFVTGTADNALRNLAITPDGAHLYFGRTVSHDVAGFDIAAEGGLTQIAGSPFAGPTTGLTSSVVTPNGRHLYVGRSPSGVVGYDIGVGGALTQVAGSPFATPGQPDYQSLAVTPNQGPTANFTTLGAPAGSPWTFDASSSSDADGSVTRFDWDFGDGTSAPDGGPTQSHVYATPGTYTVTLTVTDNEGCSASFIYTGQTASCNGGLAAVSTQQAIVTDVAPPVLKLSGSRKQKADGAVEVGVTCDEACTATARGTVTLKSAVLRRVRLAKVTRELQANGRKTLKLKLKGDARRTVQKALRDGASATAQITVKATDAAGNTSRKKRRVKLTD